MSGAAVPAVPPGTLVYAIGDIHGRLDLLERAYELIAADAGDIGSRRAIIVHLGDYVDRGPDTARTVERLIQGPPAGFEAVHLLGNHEDTLVRFLDDVRMGPQWLGFGGMATLQSYDVPRPSRGDHRERWESLRAAVRDAIPAAHLAFLRDLRLTFAIGDYLFVHAGLRPGVAIDEQARNDLIWIREEFLSSRADFGAVVVHGHTPAREPEIRPNRINIDTGACFTGRLTCLALSGVERRLLVATAPTSP